MVAAAAARSAAAKRSLFGAESESRYAPQPQSSAAALYALAERLGARAEVTWGSAVDDVDALFAFGAARGSGAAAAGGDGDRADDLIAHVPSFHGVRRRSQRSDGVATRSQHQNNGLATNAPMLADVAEHLVLSLREFLEPRLSAVKRPAAIMLISELPLTRNGKTDRTALSAMARARFSSATVPAAGAAAHEARGVILTPLQARLISVWSEVLGIGEKSLSIDDNFFHIGGDSIRSLEVVSTALAHGVTLSVRHMFLNPTIRQLAGCDAVAGSVPTLGSPAKQGGLFTVTTAHAEQYNAFPLIGIQTAYWIGQNVGDPSASSSSSSAAEEDDTGVNPHIYVEYV